MLSFEIMEHLWNEYKFWCVEQSFNDGAIVHGRKIILYLNSVIHGQMNSTVGKVKDDLARRAAALVHLYRRQKAIGENPYIHPMSDMLYELVTSMKKAPDLMKIIKSFEHEIESWSLNTVKSVAVDNAKSVGVHSSKNVAIDNSKVVAANTAKQQTNASNTVQPLPNASGSKQCSNIQMTQRITQGNYSRLANSLYTIRLVKKLYSCA